MALVKHLIHSNRIFREVFARRDQLLLEVIPLRVMSKCNNVGDGWKEGSPRGDMILIKSIRDNSLV